MKQQKYDLLLEWVKRRTDAELKILRKHIQIHQDLKILVKKCPIDLQLDLYIALGVTDPLNKFIYLLVRKQIILEEKARARLFELSLASLNYDLARRAMDYLAMHGFHTQAHELLKKMPGGKQNSQLLQIWLKMLVHGKLWKETQTLLKDIKKNGAFRKERFLLYCGLNQWTKAFKLVKEDYKWMQNNLKLTEISSLVIELNHSPKNRQKAKEILKYLPESGFRELLKAKIAPSPEEQAKGFNKVLKTYPEIGEPDRSSVKPRTTRINALWPFLRG